MSYLRVIPRDLFNEASLLKCYGQLYLNLEKMGLEGLLVHEEDGEHFDVLQDESTGAICIANINLSIGGKLYEMWRPLNSRRPYPLYLRYENEDEISVFNDDGSFTEEMISFFNRS